MREMRIVVRREFRERVRSRGYVVSTIVVPLFMLGILLVPLLVGRALQRGESAIAIVDGTPDGVGARAAEALRRSSGAGEAGGFAVAYLERADPATIDSLTNAVVAESIDGFVLLPADFLESSSARFRGRVVTNVVMLDRIEGALSAAAQAERLDRAGLDGGEVESLMRPVRLDASQITAEGEEGANLAGTLAASYAITFLLYFFILLYGAQVMQSVHEEKGGRIAEILMSTMTAPQLLAGKILGIAGAAFLQMLIWVGFGALVFSQATRIGRILEVPDSVLPTDLSIGAAVAIPIALYALLGFLLYASLYAAAAAATQDAQEAQQFIGLLVVPLIIPLILQFQLVAAPHGRVAVVLGWLPFTSPLAMPLRMGATTIGPLELIGSLSLLGLSAAFLAWAAGRIYRFGMLRTGTRPSFGEIVRWVRM